MFSFLPASRLGRHALFWVGVVGYFWLPQLIHPDYRHTVGHYFFGFAYGQSPYFVLILFAYTLGVGMLYTYAFRYWALPPLLVGRLGQGLGRFTLLTGGICYLFRLLCALHVALLDPWLRHLPSRPLDERYFQGWFTHRVYLNEYGTIILLIAIYKLLENWRCKQLLASQLAQQKLRTEIQLIKAQVNPRFMLGSLATLADQLDSKVLQAPALVLALSQFLSYVLYESQAEQVPLAHDLAAMQQYLALEQSRLGKQLDISFTLPGALPPHPVAPLLLLPLLENACQHGLVTAEADQAWLSVQVTANAQMLKVTVANSVDPDQATIYLPGRGLTSLRQRLEARYAGRYTLRLAPEPGLFVVVLTLRFAPLSSLADTAESALLFASPYESTLPAGGR